MLYLVAASTAGGESRLLPAYLHGRSESPCQWRWGWNISDLNSPSVHLTLTNEPACAALHRLVLDQHLRKERGLTVAAHSCVCQCVTSVLIGTSNLHDTVLAVSSTKQTRRQTRSRREVKPYKGHFRCL